MKSLYGTAVPKANPSTGFPRQRIPARGGARGRFNAYGRLTPTEAPSGVIVAGRKLLRVAGPIAFFVDLLHPDMLGNASASAFRMMNNPDFATPPRGLALVETPHGRWIVPEHDLDIPRGIERGLWGIAPDAPPVGVSASVSLSRTDAALAEVQGWSRATRSLDATQAMLQAKFDQFQTTLRVMRKRNLQELSTLLSRVEAMPEFNGSPPAPFSGNDPGIYGQSAATPLGFVEPDPMNYKKLVSSTGPNGLPHFEWVFDDFGYRAAMQSYWSSVHAIQRADAERWRREKAEYDAKKAQYEREQREYEDDLEEYERQQREYEQEVERVERVHATVKRNNASFEFVVSHQSQQMATNFRYKKRKNDRKTKGGLYRQFLAVLNNTYGKADEAADMAKAFLYNLHPVGTPENMAGWQAVYWNGQRELIPSTFYQGALMFADGRADLDWAGFAKSVVHNQLIDFVYGRLGQTPQLDALTNSYGGVHAGPAL